MAGKDCGVGFSVSVLEKPSKGTKNLYQFYLSELYTENPSMQIIAVEQSSLQMPVHNYNLLELTWTKSKTKS